MLQPFPVLKDVTTRKENCPLKNLPRLQFESYKIPHVAPFEALSFNCLLCNLHSLKQKTQIKRERESLINREREREVVVCDQGDGRNESRLVGW